MFTFSTVQKITSFVLSGVLLFSVCAPASAFTSSVSVPIHASEIQESVKNHQADLHRSKRGIKKWIGKLAMEGVAKTLRAGGSFVDDIAKTLGGKEAKAFSKNTDVIADALEGLVAEAEVVEQRIIDMVKSALVDAGVESSVARTIAQTFAVLAF